jgi:hypothetical protein
MAFLALFAVLALIAANGAFIALLSIRRDHMQLRARINAYGSKTQ